MNNIRTPIHDHVRKNMEWSDTQVVIRFVIFPFSIKQQKSMANTARLQKKQKEIRNFQNSLEKGAKVVTGGGIYGTVNRIDTETGKVEVEIA